MRRHRGENNGGAVPLISATTISPLMNIKLSTNASSLLINHTHASGTNDPHQPELFHAEKSIRDMENLDQYSAFSI